MTNKIINIKKRIEMLKKEIERQIYLAQSLTNNYSRVTELRFRLKMLERDKKNYNATK